MSAQIILVAEDNDDDVFLLKRALQAAGIQNETRVVANGEDAICYLKGEGKFTDRTKYPFPVLLILNLQMPRKNGGEVLAWLSTQTDLPMLKLIVLSGLLDPRLTRQAVHLGAEAFLPKPPDPDFLVNLLRGMKNLELVPSRGGYLLQLPTAPN